MYRSIDVWKLQEQQKIRLSNEKIVFYLEKQQ